MWRGGDDRDVMMAGESENVIDACRSETSRRLLIILRLDDTESDGAGGFCGNAKRLRAR